MRLIILTATSQIYKSSSLHDSNSTRTGAYSTQNQKDRRSRKLNHKHKCRYKFIYVLKNNNQCCNCVLFSFRPTEVILIQSRKIRNTQLRLTFLSCVKITSVALKLDRLRCTIGYCHNICYNLCPQRIMVKTK